MNEEWIKQLQKELKDYKEEAPDELLNEIKKEVNRRGITPVQTQRKHLVPLWLKGTSLAAASVALLFITYPLIKQNTPKEIIPLEASTNSSAVHPLHSDGPSTIMEDTKGSIQGPKDDGQAYQLLSQEQKKGAYPKRDEVEVKEPTSTTQQEVPEDKRITTEEQATPQTDNNITRNKDTRVEKEQKETYPANQYMLAMNSNSHKHKKKTITSDIFITNSLNNLGSGKSSGIPSQNTLVQNSPNFFADNFAPDFTAADQTVETKKEHHQPIQWGASFRYRINGKWSVQTGLTYTYLSSDITRRKGSVKYETAQKLHYLGIPVQINYHIWEYKKIKFYIGAGGQIERMIKGKAETKYLVKNKLQSSAKQDVTSHRLQLSATLSAGISYQFHPYLSLYIEPGASYYFDNGSKLNTFYSDEPFNANLKMGVRFHFNE